MSLFDLTGKTALITGSSRGIGRAAALELAKLGARVTVNGRKPEACEAVAAEIRAAGGQAIAHPCNISDKAQIAAMIEATVAAHGPIDILVSNAAICPASGPLSSTSDELWDRIMATNIKSNLWLANMVAPGMAAKGEGSIILISSIAALIGSRTLGAYSISKAADLQLVRSLAVEWGQQGVRVNAITPGMIRTQFSRALWQDPQALGETEKITPLGRIGEPRDIAGAVVFLASRAAHFVTGQTLVVDGGFTINSAI